MAYKTNDLVMLGKYPAIITNVREGAWFRIVYMDGLTPTGMGEQMKYQFREATKKELEDNKAAFAKLTKMYEKKMY